MIFAAATQSIRSVAVLLLLGGASAGAEDKINYTDQVLPLIEANCSKCHNSDKKKADLDLTSYQALLKGSGSGPIVASANPEASKLWKALTHAEEPFMPPNRPALPDRELEIFKQWIVGGLLESAGAKAVAAAKGGVDLALKADESLKPDGPPPMPVDLPLECLVHTTHGGVISGLAASPWAPVLAVAGQKQVLLFHTESLEPLGILPFTEGEPVEVKFSRSGKLLLAAGGCGARSGGVMVWDVVSGEHLMTLGKEYDTVLAADIRPDQSLVALGGPDRLIKLYSTKTGELQHKIKKHTDWVTALGFSPNGQMLASGDRNGGISLWDPDSGQELFTLAGHKSAITSLSWRSDSKLLASSSEDGNIKLWEVQEGRQVKTWTAHAPGVLCVSYSADGRLISCGRDNKVVLWNADGSKKRSFEFFGNIPLRVVFSHDGSRIVASDFAGRCAVWKSEDGKRIGELDPNPLPLEQQLAAARRRLAELQAQSARQETISNISNQTESATNAAVSAIDAAIAETRRLERAQTISAAYRLREELTEKKRERQQLSQDIQANEEALKQGEQELATAKEQIAKAGARLKAAREQIARAEPAAGRLSLQIQTQEAQLEKLLAQLHPGDTNGVQQKFAQKAAQ